MIGLALLTGCGEAPEVAKAIRPARLFQIEEPGESPFRRFPAEIGSKQTVRLSFDVPGHIIEFPATQGMMAEKGTLLARLDPETFQARLDAAEADLRNATTELARRRQLLEQGVISESEFDANVRVFRNAEAALNVAQRAMGDTVLVAPHDGRVAQTLANNQQTVAAGTPVLVFQDNSTLEVDVQVPEADMVRGYRGVTADNARTKLEAKLELPSIPGRQFELSLKSFSTQASAAARTFRVTFELTPPEDVNILPGMTGTVLLRRVADATMESVAQGRYLVPVPAVDARKKPPQVWKLDPDSMTVSPVPVEILSVMGASLQIQSEELQPGDELVQAGVRFLSDGTRVSRMDAPPR